MAYHNPYRTRAKTDWKVVAVKDGNEKVLLSGTWQACTYWLNNNSASPEWLKKADSFKIKA